MGKNGFLTPKAVANRQKAKGLQRLRWYCQMCQKQCRDENGCAPPPRNCSPLCPPASTETPPPSAQPRHGAERL